MVTTPVATMAVAAAAVRARCLDPLAVTSATEPSPAMRSRFPKIAQGFQQAPGQRVGNVGITQRREHSEQLVTEILPLETVHAENGIGRQILGRDVPPSLL